MMNIITDWKKIRAHFNKSFKSSLHVSIASVDKNNSPTVTPIGTLFLNDDQTGYYFEKFPSKLPVHAKNNKKICVLGVHSNRFYWIKSLFFTRFASPPAMKLYGELGVKRKATKKEISRLNRRMKWTNGLKGNTYLWKNMDDVRVVSFTSIELINLGKMTENN